eukprot:600767_1
MGQACTPGFDTSKASIVIHPQHLTIYPSGKTNECEEYTGSITVALFKDKNKLVYQASEACDHECLLDCGLWTTELPLDTVELVDLTDDPNIHGMKIQTTNKNLLIMYPVSQEDVFIFHDAVPVTDAMFSSNINSHVRHIVHDSL